MPSCCVLGECSQRRVGSPLRQSTTTGSPGSPTGPAGTPATSTRVPRSTSSMTRESASSSASRLWPRPDEESTISPWSTTVTSHASSPPSGSAASADAYRSTCPVASASMTAAPGPTAVVHTPVSASRAAAVPGAWCVVGAVASSSDGAVSVAHPGTSAGCASSVVAPDAVVAGAGSGGQPVVGGSASAGGVAVGSSAAGWEDVTICPADRVSHASVAHVVRPTPSDATEPVRIIDHSVGVAVSETSLQ